MLVFWTLADSFGAHRGLHASGRSFVSVQLLVASECDLNIQSTKGFMASTRATSWVSHLVVNRKLLEIVIEYDSLDLVQHPPHYQTSDEDLVPTLLGEQNDVFSGNDSLLMSYRYHDCLPTFLSTTIDLFWFWFCCFKDIFIGTNEIY